MYGSSDGYPAPFSHSPISSLGIMLEWIAKKFEKRATTCIFIQRVNTGQTDAAIYQELGGASASGRWQAERHKG